MAILVNGQKIKESDIVEEMERLRPDYDQYVRENSNTADTESQLREWCTENIIERELLEQAARNDSQVVPKDEIDKAYEDNKDRYGDMSKKKATAEIELGLRMQRLITDAVEADGQPSDEEIAEYYKANHEKFTAPEQVRASHIVKHVEQAENRAQLQVEILNIREQIRKGTPFEELVAEHSDCPDQGGDLGYFARGSMVQEFEDVVLSMKVDDVSEVFETPFGFHIAKLYDRHPGGLIDMDQVKDSILEDLRKEKQSKAIEDLVDGLKDKAHIER